MLKAENKIHRSQLWVLRCIIGIVFIILIARYFYIQIIRYEKYHAKAEGNRIQAVSLPAPRGLIFDRDNNILVNNYPTFVLTAIPKEFKEKESKYSIINSLTGISIESMKKNYIRYYKNNFKPVRLAKNLNFEQLSLLEENKTSLSGTHYKKLPERFYPNQINGIHILGYVREINDSKLNNMGKQNIYSLGDLTGWTGIEKVYENTLLGQKGIDFFEVNFIGEIVGHLKERTVHPIPGLDIKLTINSLLQRVMEKLMKGKRGSVLVSNGKTGEVLSYVSSPSLSPVLFTSGPTNDEWNDIINNPDTPLLDRNTSGLYPPGSIFKLIALFPLIEKNKILPNWETFCSESYTYGDRIFNCWKEGGHGVVNMKKAIAESCNIYFYQAVQSIQLDDWVNSCYNFGFGRKTLIDLPEEKKGLIPDKVYLNKKHGKWGWSKGVMLNHVLGQGEILVTPIQLLQFANIISTHGKTNTVHLNIKKKLDLHFLSNYSPRTWRLIDNFLLSAVSHVNGTGKLADPHIEGLKIYGKTGTAQNPHGEPHAWFLGYGKYNDTILSIVVLVENGGHGGEVSAPIARKAFDFYFSTYN